jgi:D-lactate dehydrogenase
MSTAAHMALLKENGLKYYLTRTAGFNHVDVKACKELGIESAFVPGYSPNAISELAVSLANGSAPEYRLYHRSHSSG